VRLVLLVTALLLVLEPAAAFAKGKPEPKQERRVEEPKRAEPARAEREKAEREQKRAEEKREDEQRGDERRGRRGDDRGRGAQAAVPGAGGRTPPPPGAAVAPPTLPPAPPPPADPALLAPPPPAEPPNPRRFAYGASLADLGRNGALLRGMGFNYVKSYMQWSGAEPSKGAYNFADADNIARDAQSHGLQLVLRVDSAPAWAATPGAGNRPPRDPNDYGEFMGALAAHLRGRVVAYELWNEPNLAVEWGGRQPSPEEFARLLQAAYGRIKAADPNALVISGGLATTGGDNGVTALDDLQFLRRMYAAGAGGHFDALGSHPYGFASGPEAVAADGASHFRRAEQHYQLMVEHGDGDRAVWATEVGWLVDPSADGKGEYMRDPSWAGRQWQRVSPEQQAQYLVDAYRHARDEWPWMGAMLLFNLDFSTVGYYPPAEQMRWYAVVNGDGTPRPAFDALRGMPKPVR
jgi:hypothetical protein